MPCPYLPSLKAATNAQLSLWPDCPLKAASGDSLAEYLASIEKIIRRIGEDESAARKAAKQEGGAGQEEDKDGGGLTPKHFPRLTQGVASLLDAFVYAGGHAPKDACNALTRAHEDSAGVTNLLVVYSTLCRLPDEKAQTDAWGLLLQRMHVVAKGRAKGSLDAESIAEEATSGELNKIIKKKNNAAWPPSCAPAAWVVRSVNRAAVNLQNKAAKKSTGLASAVKIGGGRFPQGISDRSWLIFDSLEKVKDMKEAGNNCLTPREIEHLEWRVLYFVTDKTTVKDKEEEKAAANRAKAAHERKIMIRSLNDTGWTFRTAGLSWDNLPVSLKEVAAGIKVTEGSERVKWCHLWQKIWDLIDPGSALKKSINKP